MSKEAKERIEIYKLFESIGWRYFDNENGIVNISIEIPIKYQVLGDSYLAYYVKNHKQLILTEKLINEVKAHCLI